MFNKKYLISLLIFLVVSVFLTTFLIYKLTDKNNKSNEINIGTYEILNQSIYELQIEVNGLNQLLEENKSQIQNLESSLKKRIAKEKLQDELNSISLFDIEANTVKTNNLITQLNLLYGPYSDERTETVMAVFYDQELYLKPQMILYNDDYDLEGVTPHDYEYGDGSVMIYYFDSGSSLERSYEKLENVFRYEFHTFTINKSILVVYIPYDPEYEELVDRQKKQLEDAIKLIEKEFN